MALKNFVSVLTSSCHNNPTEQQSEDDLVFDVLTLTGNNFFDDLIRPRDLEEIDDNAPHDWKRAGKIRYKYPKKYILSPETKSSDLFNILDAIPFPLDNIEWEFGGVGKGSRYESAEELLARVLEEARCCAGSEFGCFPVVILALKRGPSEEDNFLDDSAVVAQV